MEEIAKFDSQRPAARQGEWALFGCCDEKYVPYLAIALKSTMCKNPGLDAFLFTPQITQEFQSQLDNCGIHLVLFDIKKEIWPFSSSDLRWPAESFAHLFCWQILHRFGYSYSISIDGDVLCCSPLPLGDVEMNLRDVGCVSNGSVGHHLHPRLDRDGAVLARIMGFKDADYLMDSPNTGIMLWNHRRLQAIEFGTKILDLYKILEDRVFVPSDQHLFAVSVPALGLQLTMLDTRWNFCRGLETGVGIFRALQPRFHPDSRVACLDGIYFLHLFKPWAYASIGEVSGYREHTEEASILCRDATKRWIEHCEDVFGSHWMDIFEIEEFAIDSYFKAVEGLMAPCRTEKGDRLWKTQGFAVAGFYLLVREAEIFRHWVLRRPRKDRSVPFVKFLLRKLILKGRPHQSVFPEQQ